MSHEKSYINIKLTSLKVEKKFQPLLKQIIKATSEKANVGDILELDATQFTNTRGMGKKNKSLYIELQKSIPKFAEAHILNLHTSKCIEYIKKEISKTNFSINYRLLSKSEKKYLEYIERELGHPPLVHDIFEKGSRVNTKAKLLAKSSIESKIINSTYDLDKKTYPPTKKEILLGSFIIDIDRPPPPVEILEKYIIEDFEALLLLANEKERTIALCRWGYTTETLGLEAVGHKFKVTRESIRQIETKFNKLIPLSMRISTKNIQDTVIRYLEHDLKIIFPNLSTLFDKIEKFFHFLEICTQLEKNSLRDTQKKWFCKIEFNTQLLNPFFAETPSPLDKGTITDELMSSYGYNNFDAQKIFSQMIKEKKIVNTKKGYKPQNLPKAVSSAHILINFPKGLPWRDIAKLVNASSISKKHIPEDRIDGALVNNPYLYFTGVGTYCHLDFFDVDEIDIIRILDWVLRFLAENSSSNIKLDRLFPLIPSIDGVGYYEIRHILDYYGEQYGIFFLGKSRTDVISLSGKNIKGIPLKDAIFKIISEATEPIRPADIAEKIKSKSIGYVSSIISMLVSEGRLIKINRFLFTTPDKAFSDVDINEILNEIAIILDSKKIPVDVDYFREKLNKTLLKSYTKYFYSSIAKSHLNERKWYNKRSLFSSQKIPYKSLNDAVAKLSQGRLQPNEIIEQLKETIILTDHTIERVVKPLISKNSITP